MVRVEWLEGYCGVIKGVMGCYRGVRGCKGCYRVLEGVMGCYRGIMCGGW